MIQKQSYLIISQVTHLTYSMDPVYLIQSLVFNTTSVEDKVEVIWGGLNVEEAVDEKAEQIDQHLRQNRWKSMKNWRDSSRLGRGRQK